MSTTLALYFMRQSPFLANEISKRTRAWGDRMRLAPELPDEARSGAPRARHALLLNPFYAKDPHASFGKHVLTPSLALTSIAGATPPEWSVAYWDENLLGGAPPLEPFPALVGISVHLTFAERAYELARWYRERGALVVMGGLHVQSCPEEAVPHADALVLGEGTEVWPQVLADAYRDDPAPRREVLDRRAFLTTTSLIATRGCSNRCNFCYLSTEGAHMPYRVREVRQIVEEIEQDGQPYVVFLDNNLGSSPEYLRQLCLALCRLEIIWSAAVTIDVTDDPELVRLMALSGCTGVFVGFESLSDENLAGARKRTPRARDFARRVRVFHDVGIQVNGSFVLGFDHDGPEVFERTLTWIEEQRLECATFHILTPYPGTPLFREMEAEGRLLHRDWSRYDTAHVVFRPKLMEPEELEQGYAHCYERLFSHASIWRRRPEDWRAVVPYLGMSYLYKRANPLWQLLIERRLTEPVWRPLVKATRYRHLRYRRRLAREDAAAWAAPRPLPRGLSSGS